MSQNLLPPRRYIVRLRCLLPVNSSQATSLIITPKKSNSVMTTTTKNLSPNSFTYTSSKTTTTTTTSESTCNICKRLLYAFEEVLRCRVCYGSYHWRCVKPQRVSRYGQNDSYICENCNAREVKNSSYRSSNGTKSTESYDTNDRESIDVISRTNSIETNTEDPSRHYEDKQQSQSQNITKITELDDYLPPQTNGDEYYDRNSQYNDDSRTIRRIQQEEEEEEEENAIESDDENDRSTMFQAKYQYTPLKEFAAMRNNRTNNDYHISNYPNSPSDNSNRQLPSRYGGGLHYTNHGYDPTVTRLVEPPSMGSTNFTSPTVDNLPIHNRQNHFISTTNLDVNEQPSRHQQQSNSLVHSTSSSSPPNYENDSSIFKPLSQQQQSDRQSTVESDSGIATVTSISQQPQQQIDENHIVEKKLADLVQQLGKQLENDAQKLNDKLETKLKNLENMIHQQTYVIRRQDEVIERLKGQILHIESERDHFRHRLSVHERIEQIEKKQSIPANETEKFYKQHSIDEQDEQSNRKYFNTSTVITENSKPSTKKTPAPRVDNQWSTTNNEHEPTIAKLVTNAPINRERLESDSSSASSVSGKLVSSVPIVETPAASSRLDNIIHQSTTTDVRNPSSTNYSLAEVRHQDRPHTLERVSIEQQIVTSVHHDDSDDENTDDNILKQKRSSSSSSSSSARSLPAQPAQTNSTSITNRNPNKYPSFETLQSSYQIEQNPKLSTKTTSLQFGTKPVRDDETGSIYITPIEPNQPAIQSNGLVKGWLRKQNRDSFLKRIERYYCVLKNNTLLMHGHDYDRTPQKVVTLKGAKVLYYDDAKYGPSLELTWSNRSNDPKHYHLYAPNPQEAEQWVTGIQTAIHNVENKNNWQRYRMNT